MKTCIIFNPMAGTAAQMEALRARIEARPDLDLYEPSDPAHVRRAVIAAAERRAPMIVAAGGDGTVSAVVNAMILRRAGATLGVIPLGTGNDLARTLALPLDDPLDALALLDQGETRAIDLIKVRVGKRILFGTNCAAGGFTGQMNEAMTDQIKQTWGPLAYLRGAVKVLPDLTRYHTSIRIDGRAPQRVGALNVIIANGRTAGGGTVVAPQANPEDGLLDVVIVHSGSMVELTGVAARLLAGNYTTSGLVTHERARRVEVWSKPGMWFNVDGELLSKQRTVFSALPRALRVVVGPGYRAQVDGGA
jgi:diacylglycerol kinase (ATP)